MFYDSITDFIFMEDEPRPADVIFVPGSHRPDCAQRAAALFHAGFAPRILPSGRYSKLKGAFPDPAYETEWAFLRQVLLRAGVPEEAILQEDRATFTWENAIFSRQVLEREHLPFENAILCCQAFHARRAYMYYKQQFPETEILVVPVVTMGITRDNWFLSAEKTDVVLGEVQRIGEQFHCCLPIV